MRQHSHVEEEGRLGTSADRASRPTAPAGLGDTATIADAEWPLWAAVTEHQEFRNGSLCTITGFRWLFAPTETDAVLGVREMMSDEYPNRKNVEVFARAVPEDELAARRAQGMGASGENSRSEVEGDSPPARSSEGGCAHG